MSRKFIAAISALTLAAAGFAGCSDTPVRDSGRLSIVCTIFPIYDWTREIIGSGSDDVELTYLMSSGADLHNYQPTAADMITISDCDVFIYLGGESDEWVEDSLSEARNKDMTVISLMDVLSSSLREEELKEGMEEVDEIGYDEHIWLSLRNAVTCVREISDRLAAVDSGNSDVYGSNADNYIDRLNELDCSFTELTSCAKNKTLIFGDRFPFRYFVEDYGLDYYAAFMGCSADSEASFSTIAFLADKADELDADTIFAIEGSYCTITEVIASSTKSGSQEIAVLDSVQSVTRSQINDGISYIKIMENNYDVLKEALN